MNKKLTTALFFTLSLVLLSYHSLSLAKTSVAIGDVTGTAVENHHVDTVRMLMQSEIIKHSQALYVSEGAQKLFSAHISRLEDNYVLTMESKEAGYVAQSEQAKISDFDEVDTAVKRLVSALIEETSLANTAQRGAVLEKEQVETTRLKSIRGWEVFVGGALPLTASMGNYQPLYVLSGGYVFDIESFLIEIRADLMGDFTNLSRGASSFTIGGHYVWHDARQYALYSGLEFGFGQANPSGGDPQLGFVVAGDIGVLLMRHADINMDVRFRTMVVANEYQNAVPVIGSLMLGVHF